MFTREQILKLCAQTMDCIERNANIAGILLPPNWADAVARNLVPALLETIDTFLEEN